MMLLTPDDVTADELAALATLIESLPDGQLREAIAYMHDALTRGNTVFVGVHAGGAA